MVPHLRGLEFALGEAARGSLGDICEWGGVAWAKLGSCCWKQWPSYGLYNASRARRGERSPMALRVAQALPPPQLAEQAPHAILHRFAPPRMGLAFLAGAPPTRRPPGTLSIAEHPLNAARRRSNDLITRGMGEEGVARKEKKQNQPVAGELLLFAGEIRRSSAV